MTFVKGQSGNPEGKKLGTKNKTTLLKEERRAMFDEEVSKLWKATVKKLLENEPKYIADQFIGKPTETIKHEGLEFLFEDEKDK